MVEKTLKICVYDTIEIGDEFVIRVFGCSKKKRLNPLGILGFIFSNPALTWLPSMAHAPSIINLRLNDLTALAF